MKSKKRKSTPIRYHSRRHASTQQEGAFPVGGPAPVPASENQCSQSTSIEQGQFQAAVWIFETYYRKSLQRDILRPHGPDNPKEGHRLPTEESPRTKASAGVLWVFFSPLQGECLRKAKSQNNYINIRKTPVYKGWGKKKRGVSSEMSLCIKKVSFLSSKMVWEPGNCLWVRCQRGLGRNGRRW